MDISVANWFANLDPDIQLAFNSTAMATIPPSKIVFGAAVAYRETQEAYNNGTSVQVGAYLNFASPLLQDLAPSVDNAGAISTNSTITLRAKTVYTPSLNIQPQQSTTII